MTTITIKYNSENQTAILSTDNQSLAWTEVNRAYSEETIEINQISNQAFQIPWWVFINNRLLLAHYVNKFNIELSFNEDAEDKLQQVLEIEKHYHDIRECNVKKISKDELIRKLESTGFKRILTKFQIRNLLRIVNLHAAADFSVPGAGKTTEAIAYYYYNKEPGDKLLIICPKNAFAVWEEQFSECVSDELKIIRIIGGYTKAKKIIEKKADIYLISYQFLINIKYLISKLISEGNYFLILDESHKMKAGASNKTGQAILELSYLPKRKLILSGTPLPNSIQDLVPQFIFLYPEVEPEEENIKEYIAPIYVRTTKNELKIPGIKRKSIPIPLNPNQRYLYNLLTSEFLRLAQEDIGVNLRAKLRKIGKSAIRLLQAISNPSLLIDSEWADNDIFSAVLEDGDSPKLQYACLRARQLAEQNKKVIIWSSFVKNIELIALRLIDLGADFIHGQVDTGSDEEDDTREAKIKRFHEDKNAFVLVGNPAACGESISLHTVCHNAIYVDRTYNAAHYLQSEDRIHRLGIPPKTETIIEILNSPLTIDDSVGRRLLDKIRLMKYVLEDNDLNVEPDLVTLDDMDIELSDLGINKYDADDMVNELQRDLELK